MNKMANLTNLINVSTNFTLMARTLIEVKARRLQLVFGTVTSKEDRAL